MEQSPEQEPKPEGPGGKWLRGDWWNPETRRGLGFGVVGLLLLILVLGKPGRRGPAQEILSVTGDRPGATRMADGARPDSLHLDFSGSAARLDQIGKPPGRGGVQMIPALKGRWVWESDRRLTFTPSTDWGVGTAYRVRLDPALFPPHVKLDRYEYRFMSAPFTASLVNSQFYIDPKDPRIKQIVATVRFSHPVDTAALEKRISLVYEEPGHGIFRASKRPLAFTVTYDKFMGEAYVHSATVAIPPEEAAVRVVVAEGVRAARGGPPIAAALEEGVRVPGMYDFFHFQDAQAAIARNERYEPEQVLILNATTGVLESEMSKRLSVFVLPKDRPAAPHQEAVADYDWPAAQVGPEVLRLSTTVVLEPIPAELEYSAVQTFRFKAPAGRRLFVRVDRGVAAFGGYVLAKPFEAVVTAPEFPKELKIMHDGAILNLSGQHKLSIFALELSDLRFELGRVMPGEINHLASQTGGDFAHPVFENYRFGQDDVTERFTETRALQRREPGQAQYSAFDFSRYLESGRRGLFFFRVEEWDPVDKRPTGLADTRLVLITDLGLLVKDNADGSHDVFIQSLATGRPAAGARVDVVGKNGLAVVSAVAGDTGRAHFPKLSDFTREKTPTVYVVRHGEDLSFLPFDRADRRVDYSRFDVGGVQTHGQGERLEAFVFSDRGLYRPGDTLHAAFLVRSLDWAQPLAGLPVEVAFTDARGLEVQKTKISLSSSAFEEASYKTEENGPTGSYQVGVYIIKDNHRGALLGSTALRVEEFLPDRMRIATRFSKERAEGWLRPDGLKASVSLHNLFGTPAEGRRVTGRLSLSPSAPSFKAYPGFCFFDPAQAAKSFTERLSDGVTDAQGEASFELDLARFAAGTYRVSFAAEGFEAEGGRGVASESSALISPRDYLVGLKADGDLQYVSRGSTRTVQLVALGPDAKPAAAAGLRAQVIEERYVSVLIRQPDGTYRYQSVKKQTTLKTWALTVPAATIKVALPTDHAGDFELVIRDGADVDLNRIGFTVVGRANLTRALDRNAELQVRLNKGDFLPGETIELSIKAPYVGAGLITIERDRVLAHRWFKTETTASVQTIQVPENLDGNAYVNVSFLRSVDSREIFMSPLSYGVAPFTVSLKRRALAVDLEAPEKLLPGGKYRIRYRAARASKIAIYAVDEGILQVAGYKTPDPLAAFFKKRALEVRTFQILDLLLPEFSVAMAAMAPGGDKDGLRAIGANLNPFKRKRDKPAVYWSGLKNAGPEWREVVYEVPDTFHGTLRLMAVAADRGAVGVAERATLVRGPFVLSPNAPTFAAPGDEFDVSVGVANGVEGSGPEAKVIVALETSGHLQVLGSATATLTIAEGREGSVVFRVKAKPSLGSARLTFTAAHDDQRSRQAVELSVRPPLPYRTTVVTGSLKSGTAKVPTPRRMYPRYRVLQAAVSPLPLGLSRGLVQYLVSYPYGCTEQLVSQAFPALVLRHRPEFGYKPAQVEAILQDVLHTLRSRQTAEGAFGFWAANSNVSDFQAVYALHFLTEARERGYTVPADMLTRGLAYLNAIVANQPGATNPPRVRAYALYVLTRNGQVTTAALDTLRQELERDGDKSWRGTLTGVYMAGAYQMLHLDAQASALINAGRGGGWRPALLDYRTFYDELTHDAQFLYILARHFPSELDSLAPEALEGLVRGLERNSYNTLSSAYAILALDSYASAYGPVTADTAKLFERLEAGGRAPMVLPAGLFPVAEYTGRASAVDIEDAGGRRLFYQVTAAGFDLAPPSAEIVDGLEVQREFRDSAGKVVSRAALGAELTVHLKVRGLNASRPNVAVVDLLPGGFEVVEDRRAPEPQAGPAPEPESEPAASEGDCGEDGCEAPARAAARPSGLVRKSSLEGGWQPDYVDVREDRVVLYGSAETGVQEYVYRIKATNRGSFSVPPPFGESMYDRTVEARGLASRLDVE